MADTAETLLRFSEEIVFVDPYFDPLDGTFRGPMQQFLKKLRCDGKIRRIEILTVTKKPEITKDDCDQLLEFIPDGQTLKIRQFEKHPQLHNRYIITELGAIGIGHGLGRERKKYDGKHLLDDMDLKEKQAFKDLSEMYFKDPLEFKLEYSVCVKGTRNPRATMRSSWSRHQIMQV